MHVTGLECLVCSAQYEAGEVEYTCPACGIDGILDVLYDYERIAAELSADSLAADGRWTLWRYLPLLPIASEAGLPRLRVGWTPVYEAPRLARQLGVARVWVKDEGQTATGSTKDRASAVGATRAASLGRTIVACASTGNAASSLAGMAADLCLEAKIFVPKSAPEAKVAQLLVYGAQVFLVDGSYEDAFDLSQQSVEAFGWYNRNCAVNPYLVEGKKTAGLEIAEQLRESLPDVVTVPVGDGCVVSGISKGLGEMHRLGVIDRVPRIIGVQAENAAPIANAFSRGEERLVPVEAATLADSINVGTPRNWRKGLRSVRATGGAFVTVTDEAILAAIPGLARGCGVFAEPTACAALAGAHRARELSLIDEGESVLILATGNGLKDTRGAMRAVEPPQAIAKDLEEVRRVLSLA